MIKNKSFNQDFDQVLEELVHKNTYKGNEYMREDNRFHNFEIGAEWCEMSVPRYLWALRSKHEVSIRDMILDLEKDTHWSSELWLEKITDNIMYLILLYSYIKNMPLEVE